MLDIIEVIRCGLVSLIGSKVIVRPFGLRICSELNLISEMINARRIGRKPAMNPPVTVRVLHGRMRRMIMVMMMVMITVRHLEKQGERVKDAI